MQQNPVAQSHWIQTFGSLQIHSAGDSSHLRGEKPRSLLAYLVLHPRSLHRREMLADMLWPDAPPRRVRRNLSDVLYRLQKVIGPGWLRIDDDTLAFRSDTDLWVDVWEFDRLIEAGETVSCQKAVDLYQGDLLPEIDEEWILPERELRRSQYLAALETLYTHHEVQGKLQQALLYARRLIVAEPLHEPAHQAYLRLLGRLKRFSEAAAHYEYLSTLLRAELNTGPMAETRAILQALERERDLEETPAVAEEMKPFIGRKKERTAALTAVESMLKGSGGILAVEGEAGIGKSRLLWEVMAGARWRGAVVLEGHASETPRASPFSPLVEALTTLIHSPRGQQFEADLGEEVAGALTPLAIPWRTREPPPEALTQQAGRRFYHALQQLGETLARSTPTVLALDDLHWADPALWEALRAFGLGFARHGGLLILAYRRPGIETLPGWKTIQDWDRDGLLKTLALEPLSVDEVAQFIAGTMEVDPIQVHAWTAGNPFFIQEWLAGPASKPPTNRSAIAFRLQSLSPSARSALECAAILGRNVPYGLWMGLTGLAPLELADLGDELIARQWLFPSTDGYAFVHDLLRSAVYEEIEPLRRRKLHERTAGVHQSLEPDNLRSRAFHLDRAGLVPQAAAAYQRAGDQELDRFAYREAQAAFERSLALLPSVPTVERMQVLLSLAWAFDVLGEREREFAVLAEALAGVRQTRHKALELRTLLATGRAMTQTYQYAQADEQLLHALELARKLRDRVNQTEAYLLLGTNKTGLLSTREAMKYYRRALKLAQRTSSLSQEARALRGIGISTRESGMPAGAIRWLEQALEVERRIGDRLGETVTQSNLVTVYYDLGAWDRLMAVAGEIQPRVDALGYRYNAGYLRHLHGLALYNLGDHSGARQQFLDAERDFEATGASTTFVTAALGLIAEDEGNPVEALQLYRRALASIEESERKRELPVLHLDLGALLWRLGQPKEAIAYLEAARAAWPENQEPISLLKSEAFLGLAKLAVDERSEAGQLASRGWAAFEAGVPTGEKPQGWLWALYLLLTGLEQHESAQVVLRATYVELQRQARAISSPEHRQNFFSKVPLNRAIVDVYDQITKPVRRLTVPIARREASLGRSLRADEYVAVNWTIHAPEDEAIADKTEQRHYRLKRLLSEAERQGAAPTDDDLARALGVSRRTILRDMQVLSGEILHPPTRRRKAGSKAGFLSQ